MKRKWASFVFLATKGLQTMRIYVGAEASSGPVPREASSSVSPCQEQPPHTSIRAYVEIQHSAHEFQ